MKLDLEQRDVSSFSRVYCCRLLFPLLAVGWWHDHIPTTATQPTVSFSSSSFLFFISLQKSYELVCQARASPVLILPPVFDCTTERPPSSFQPPVRAHYSTPTSSKGEGKKLISILPRNRCLLTFEEMGKLLRNWIISSSACHSKRMQTRFFIIIFFLNRKWCRGFNAVDLDLLIFQNAVEWQAFDTTHCQIIGNWRDRILRIGDRRIPSVG